VKQQSAGRHVVESINRTGNTTVKRNRTKGQTTIYKPTQKIKVRTTQTPPKTGLNQVLRKGKQFLLH